MPSKDLLKDYFIKMWQLVEELTRRGISPQQEYASMMFDNLPKLRERFQEQERLGVYGKIQVQYIDELIRVVRQRKIMQPECNRQDTSTTAAVQHERSPKTARNIAVKNRTQGIKVDRQKKRVP